MSSTPVLPYKRVILKLSGESFSHGGERGIGMQEASAAVPSGMSALRCEEPVAADACAKARAKTGGVCVVANLNAPGQVVIAGAPDACSGLM